MKNDFMTKNDANYLVFHFITWLVHNGLTGKEKH